MKIYLAARYTRRAEMEEIANMLKDKGIETVARWVYGAEEVVGVTRDQCAIIDLEDVDKADIVVSFTHPRGTPTPGGGRHVEFGYGLAKGKKMVVIGERENVFHWHPSVQVYPSLSDWLSDPAE